MFVNWMALNYVSPVISIIVMKNSKSNKVELVLIILFNLVISKNQLQLND